MDTLRAILLMILAMALLALSDLFIKLGAGAAPLGQVMAWLSLGGTALFALYARLGGVTLFSRDALHPTVILRNGCEIVAAVGLVLGIAAIPLSLFAAIMQAAPILVTLGGAAILGETVGWRRWAAVLAGLLGMMIVIRPGTAGFDPAALWAVMGVSALAARDLVTRRVPEGISSLALSTWGFAATIPAGLFFLALGAEPVSVAPAALWPILGAVLVTTTGYLAITNAMRMAPVSVVAPFRYARLLFTTALGMTVFAERPDGPTILGAAIILGAGLYTFLRERRLALAPGAPAGAGPGGVTLPK